MKLNPHHLFMMRHAEHRDDKITTQGDKQCEIALLKINGFLIENDITKCILIFDEHYNRARETAEKIFYRHDDDIATHIYSVEESVTSVYRLNKKIDSFLTQESPTRPTLVVFVGSCGDIPNMLFEMNILSEIYSGSELEQVLGHTNYFHINELLEFQPKITGGFNLDNIKAFVH